VLGAASTTRSFSGALPPAIEAAAPGDLEFTADQLLHRIRSGDALVVRAALIA